MRIFEQGQFILLFQCRRQFNTIKQNNIQIRVTIIVITFLFSTKISGRTAGGLEHADQ